MPRAGLDPAQVVAAAARIADTGGLPALSLQAVARRLGVQTPSLYNHVAGLSELRRLLALDGIRGVRAALSAAAIGRSSEDAVRAMAVAYRAYAHAHPGRYAAAQSAPTKGDREAQAEATQVAEVLFAALRGFGLSEGDLVHATRALRSAMHGFIALEAVGGFGLPEDRDESYRRLTETVIDGMRAAASRSRPRRAGRTAGSAG